MIKNRQNKKLLKDIISLITFYFCLQKLMYILLTKGGRAYACIFLEKIVKKQQKIYKKYLFIKINYDFRQKYTNNIDKYE